MRPGKGQREISIEVKTGTANTVPAPRTLTRRPLLVWQLTVPPGSKKDTGKWAAGERDQSLPGERGEVSLPQTFDAGTPSHVTVFVSAGHKAAAVPRYRRLRNQCPHDPLIFLLDTDKPFIGGALP